METNSYPSSKHDRSRKTFCAHASNVCRMTQMVFWFLTGQREAMIEHKQHTDRLQQHVDWPQQQEGKDAMGPKLEDIQLQACEGEGE